MALPFIVVPEFPNVPRVPGVPQVLRSATAAVNTVSLLVSDALSLFGLGAAGQWGIFDSDGNLVIEPDSVVSFEFKNDSQDSDYPVEEGAFASYNKVATPFDVRVSMTKGGSAADRQSFLETAHAISQSLDLYDVVTPEMTYPSVNIDHIDYRRTQKNGAGLITIDFWLLEIRVTGTTQFTQTKQPSGQDQVNGGTVQPQAPPTTSRAANALAGA